MINKIFECDVLEGLRQMPDGIAHTCVTSPPYYGLRDYGVDGQIGLEETPEEFIEKLVAVFREVKRVLRDDGTAWINMGDSYNHGKLKKYEERNRHKSGMHFNQDQSGIRDVNLKEKDLMGMPWRLAFALQADGWYLRQDLIWHKPNPMPESVSDRCTKAHEYIFLLSKSKQYYFDQEAILEDVSPNTHARFSQDMQNQKGSDRAHGGKRHNGPMKPAARKKFPSNWDTDEGHHGSFHRMGRNPRPMDNKGGNQGSDNGIPPMRKMTEPGSGNKNNSSFDAAMLIMPEKRNKRSVWSVTTKPFSEAHFATFPQDLIVPCILAGSPHGGIVLDPFMGARTTAIVAVKQGRNYLGCELNPEYNKIGEKRMRDELGLFNQ